MKDERFGNPSLGAGRTSDYREWLDEITGARDRPSEAEVRAFVDAITGASDRPSEAEVKAFVEEITGVRERPTQSEVSAFVDRITGASDRPSAADVQRFVEQITGIRETTKPWNPALHPRGGHPENPGEFSTAWGSGAGARSGRPPEHNDLAPSTRPNDPSAQPSTQSSDQAAPRGNVWPSEPHSQAAPPTGDRTPRSTQVAMADPEGKAKPIKTDDDFHEAIRKPDGVKDDELYPTGLIIGGNPVYAKSRYVPEDKGNGTGGYTQTVLLARFGKGDKETTLAILVKKPDGRDATMTVGYPLTADPGEYRITPVAPGRAEDSEVSLEPPDDNTGENNITLKGKIGGVEAKIGVSGDKEAIVAVSIPKVLAKIKDFVGRDPGLEKKKRDTEKAYTGADRDARDQQRK